MHQPPLWKFRLLHAIHAKGRTPNRQLLDVWERAEGSKADNNPLDTTQPWPGATDYNSVGVKNYPSAAAGIAATAATLVNGHYNGLVADLRTSSKSAAQMIEDNRAEIQTWGTNPELMLQLLT